MYIKRMHTYDAHGLPYFTSSSDVMQFREDCYTVVSYAPYILLQIYAITNLATFGVTIFDFFHLGPQPKCGCAIVRENIIPYIRTKLTIKLTWLKKIGQ